MSRVLKIKNAAGIYFVTFTVIHWIDLFTRATYCDIVLDSLRHCQAKKGMVVHAFVIMSSHLPSLFPARKAASHCPASSVTSRNIPPRKL